MTRLSEGLIIARVKVTNVVSELQGGRGVPQECHARKAVPLGIRESEVNDAG